ncbi:hypothetical protein BREVNS_1459 [Brevinematales bacterium NS]|nr:hypothetical protein BREVNS_1459 [Brevinematales bacterium NS]
MDPDRKSFRREDTESVGGNLFCYLARERFAREGEGWQNSLKLKEKR